MTYRVAAALLVGATFFSAAFTVEASPAAPPKLQCEVGPLKKTYGGSNWLVYSCSDGKTVLIVSDAGNPAGPFFFEIYLKDGVYKIYGEGNGSKDASDAALRDISLLDGGKISALIEETKAGR